MLLSDKQGKLYFRRPTVDATVQCKWYRS